MADPQDDIIQRLTETVASWNSEVTDAQQELTRQIAETRAQLQTLVRVLARRREEGAEGEAPTVDDLDVLKQETALQELTQRNAELTVETETARSAAEKARQDQRETANALRRSREEVAQLRVELQGREQRIAETVEREQEFANTLQRITVERDQFREQAEQASRQLAERQLALESAQGEADGLKRTLVERETAAARVGEVEEEATRLRGEIERLSGEAAAAAQQHTAELVEARGLSQRLEEERDAVRAELGRLHCDHARIAQEYERVQAELSEARQRADKMRPELESAQVSLVEAREDIERLQDLTVDHEAAAARVTELESEREHLRQQVSELRERAAGAERIFEEEREARERAEQRLAEEQAAHQAAQTELAELHPKLHEAQVAAVRVGELESEANLLRERVLDAEAAREEERGLREAEQQEAAQLRDTLAQREETQRHAEEERHRLNEQVAGFRQEIERLSADLGEANASRQELTSQLETALQQVESRHQAGVAEGVALETVQAEVLQLRDELDRAQTSAREQGERMEHLRGELHEWRELAEASVRETDDMRALLGEHDKALAEARQHEAEVAQRLQQLREELAHAQSHRHELERDLNDAREHQNVLQQRLDEHDQAMHQAQARAQELEALLLERERALPPTNDLEQTLQAVRSEQEELRKQAADAATNESRLQERIYALEQQLEEERQRRGETEGQAQTVPLTEAAIDDERVHELQRALDLARRQCDGEAAARAELRNQVDTLHDELRRLREGLGPEATPAQRAREQHQRIIQAAFDSRGRKRMMGEILVSAGVLPLELLEAALNEQRGTRQRRLGAILVQKGFVTEETIAQVLAAQLNLPFVRLAEEHVESGALKAVSDTLATHHLCLPLRIRNNHLLVAMANPLDLIALEDLELAGGMPVQPVVATMSEITAAIVRYYGGM